MNPKAALPLLMLALGCREERTWVTGITLAPGETAEGVYVATQIDDLEGGAGYNAEDCAAPEFSEISSNLNILLTDWDSWSGECWGEITISVDGDAEDDEDGRLSAQVAFHFNLCDARGDCPTDRQNEEQVRPLVVTLD